MISFPQVPVRQMVYSWLVGLKPLYHAPPYIVRDTSGLFLGKGRQQRQHEYAIFGQGVDVLLFELD